MSRWRVFACLVALVFASVGHAATGMVVGKVQYIRTHDPLNTSWKPPVFWFTIEGVTAAGCQKWNNLALFVAESDQALSILLASLMADRSVQVWFDTAVMKNAFCKAVSISAGSPPPNL